MDTKETRKTLRELIKLQKEYNFMVFEAHGQSGFLDISREAMDRALLDELGELNHEFKADWCFWRFTQEPVNRERALEELADVMHFVLMKVLRFAAYTEYDDYSRKHEIFNNTYINQFIKAFDDADHSDDIDWIPWRFSDQCISLMRYAPDSLGTALASLIKECGFTFEEACESYKRKNAINRERVRSGY